MPCAWPSACGLQPVRSSSKYGRACRMPGTPSCRSSPRPGRQSAASAPSCGRGRAIRRIDVEGSAAASISDGSPGGPSIIADAGEPAVGDRDQFYGAPRPLLDRLVPLLSELLYSVGRQAQGLEIDLVGPSLVMEARGVDRFLRAHAIIDNVHDRLEHSSNDARATGTAEDEDDPAVFFDECRGHRRERPLPGRNGVGLTLDEPVEVGRTRLYGEIVHFVVEKKPGAGRDDIGAERAVDRIGHRYRI